MRRAWVLVLCSCLGNPDPECETVKGGIPDGLTLGACSDGREREISCWRAKPEDDWGCTCEVAGQEGTTFNWPAKAERQGTDDRRDLESFVARQCGWSLQLR